MDKWYAIESAVEKESIDTSSMLAELKLQGVLLLPIPSVKKGCLAFGPDEAMKWLGAGTKFSQAKKLAQAVKGLELQQTTMEGFNQEHVIGIPLASFAYADDKTQGKEPCSALALKKDKKNSFIHRMSKLSQKTDTYVQGFKEHITLGPKISETVKGKLSFGAKVLQAGSIVKVFRQYFPVEKDEKLLKAFQCYISTTAGPIAGMLFISTEKIAFHSDRPLDLTSPKGRITRMPYKVMIPTKRIKSAAIRDNLYNPDEKYIDVVTVDGFDFWFMGFISYTKSFKYLQCVISELR